MPEAQDGDGGHVDDGAAAARDHLRYGEPDQTVRGEDVHFEYVSSHSSSVTSSAGPWPVLVALLLTRMSTSFEPAFDLGGQCRHLLFAADVADQWQDAAGQSGQFRRGRIEVLAR